uniref:Uncharacterized protein n=1 Tax=Helianthus annuus TaxID=4232 RepID=A0A251TM68_HELAN
MLTESQGPHHNAINRLIFRLVSSLASSYTCRLSHRSLTRRFSCQRRTTGAKDLARYATFSCCVELSDHPSLGVVAFTWTSHSS